MHSQTTRTQNFANETSNEMPRRNWAQVKPTRGMWGNNGPCQTTYTFRMCSEVQTNGRTVIVRGRNMRISSRLASYLHFIVTLFCLVTMAAQYWPHRRGGHLRRTIVAATMSWCHAIVCAHRIETNEERKQLVRLPLLSNILPLRSGAFCPDNFVFWLIRNRNTENGILRTARDKLSSVPCLPSLGEGFSPSPVDWKVRIEFYHSLKWNKIDLQSLGKLALFQIKTCHSSTLQYLTWSQRNFKRFCKSINIQVPRAQMCTTYEGNAIST